MTLTTYATVLDCSEKDVHVNGGVSCFASFVNGCIIDIDNSCLWFIVNNQTSLRGTPYLRLF
jgi:hypothetical protein